MELAYHLVVLVALFIASAFFSGSETALFSLSRMDLRQLRRERNPMADKLHALLDQPRRLIISVLCGNQVVNVAATANLTGILVALYGAEKAAWISTVVMVPLLLLFGEATPKTIAISNPVKVSTRLIARPMYFWVNLIAPLTSAIRFVSDRITTRFVGDEKAADNILQVDEFRSLLDEGVVSGELSATERALIYNLLQAGSAEIIEVMVPRTQVHWIDANQPMQKIVDRFLSLQHQRVPVYRGQRDSVIGFLFAEDVMRILLDEIDPASLKLEELLHPAAMVPATKKIDEMFDYFQSNDLQAVIVLNEFGGVDGLLTMNDVLTCIFGRAEAQSDEGAALSGTDQSGYELLGNMKLIDVNRLTNYGLEDARMTTIGGVVLRQLDRLPAVGDVVPLDGFRIEVLEMDEHRVARVRISHSGEHGGAKS